MMRDERWMIRYNEVMDFMENNHRYPAKHYPDENLKHHWAHHNRKLLNSDQLKEERKELFERQLASAEKCKHVNQYA